MTVEKTMTELAKLVAGLTDLVKAALKAGLSREDVLAVVQLIASGIEQAEED